MKRSNLQASAGVAQVLVFKDTKIRQSVVAENDINYI
jgi:hypothetical protein